MKKLLIWDFDGVIADSEKLWVRAWDEVLISEKNIRIPTIVDFIKKMRDKGIKLDNVDNINELIKTIYREMR